MRFLIVSIFFLFSLVPTLVSAKPIPIDSISQAKKNGMSFLLKISNIQLKLYAQEKVLRW